MNHSPEPPTTMTERPETSTFVNVNSAEEYRTVRNTGLSDATAGHRCDTEIGAVPDDEMYQVQILYKGYWLIVDSQYFSGDAAEETAAREVEDGETVRVLRIEVGKVTLDVTDEFLASVRAEDERAFGRFRDDDGYGDWRNDQRDSDAMAAE